MKKKVLTKNKTLFFFSIFVTLKFVNLERNEKIIWKKNLGELGYFLRILKEKKTIDYETITDVCNVASQFFVNKKRDSISGEQILKSRTPNEKSIAMIDKLFN